MRVETKKEKRILERKLARELTAEELERAFGGGLATTSCSGGCADD